MAKLLARNGPRGWYSQDWMSRADQSLSRERPKMCCSARFDWDGFAERIACADVCADFQFIIEHRAEGGCLASDRFGLSVGATDVGSAEHQRRGAAVIGDGHPFVVGQERIVGAEELADVRGVVDGGVEVGVVVNCDGLE